MTPFKASPYCNGTSHFSLRSSGRPFVRIAANLSRLCNAEARGGCISDVPARAANFNEGAPTDSLIKARDVDRREYLVLPELRVRADPNRERASNTAWSIRLRRPMSIRYHPKAFRRCASRRREIRQT